MDASQRIPNPGVTRSNRVEGIVFQGSVRSQGQWSRQLLPWSPNTAYVLYPGFPLSARGSATTECQRALFTALRIRLTSTCDGSVMSAGMPRGHAGSCVWLPNTMSSSVRISSTVTCRRRRSRRYTFRVRLLG